MLMPILYVCCVCVSTFGLLTAEAVLFLRVDVLMPVNVKITVVWKVAPCSLMDGCRRFGGTYLLSTQRYLRRL
jgi:hypothetical protein